MNHRSETIIKYAEALNSQIEGLENTLKVRTGELCLSQMNVISLQKRIEELELTVYDRGAESQPPVGQALSAMEIGCTDPDDFPCEETPQSDAGAES